MIKVNCPCGANLEVSASGQFQAIDEQYRAKEFYEAHTSCLIHESARAEWEAKEKALRELANEWASFSWAPFMNPAARLKAILNREQEKQP